MLTVLSSASFTSTPGATACATIFAYAASTSPGSAFCAHTTHDSGSSRVASTNRPTGSCTAQALPEPGTPPPANEIILPSRFGLPANTASAWGLVIGGRFWFSAQSQTVVRWPNFAMQTSLNSFTKFAAASSARAGLQTTASAAAATNASRFMDVPSSQAAVVAWFGELDQRTRRNSAPAIRIQSGRNLLNTGVAHSSSAISLIPIAIKLLRRRPPLQGPSIRGSHWTGYGSQL